MWQTIWTIVFVVVIGAFAVMSVLVSIMGAFDVKRLLRELKDDQDDSTSKSKE